MSEPLPHTPDVSGQVPCISPNMFPQALDTAAILASTGRLWMTNETSLRCCRASVWAWPRMPNPVMSVAACALKVCMRPAATEDDREESQTGFWMNFSLIHNHFYSVSKRSAMSSSCSGNRQSPDYDLSIYFSCAKPEIHQKAAV